MPKQLSTTPTAGDVPTWDAPENRTIRDYRLVCTCGACPEQYDVYRNNVQVAYLRLRHGWFKAVMPRPGGRVVYESATIGDGSFEPDERKLHITRALQHIRAVLTPPGTCRRAVLTILPEEGEG